VTKGWRQLHNEELMVCTSQEILLEWHVKQYEIWGEGVSDRYRGEETYKHTQYFAETKN
jgi:hypothetical protein